MRLHMDVKDLRKATNVKLGEHVDYFIASQSSGHGPSYAGIKKNLRLPRGARHQTQSSLPRGRHITLSTTSPEDCKVQLFNVLSRLQTTNYNLLTTLQQHSDETLYLPSCSSRLSILNRPVITTPNPASSG